MQGMVSRPCVAVQMSHRSSSGSSDSAFLEQQASMAVMGGVIWVDPSPEVSESEGLLVPIRATVASIVSIF